VSIAQIERSGENERLLNAFFRDHGESRLLFDALLGVISGIGPSAIAVQKSQIASAGRSLLPGRGYLADT
jgi:hypothetical protein